MGIDSRLKDAIWTCFHKVDKHCKTCAKYISCGHKISNKVAHVNAHHEMFKSSKES